VALGFIQATYNPIFSWVGSGVSLISLAPAIGPLISPPGTSRATLRLHSDTIRPGFQQSSRDLSTFVGPQPGTWFHMIRLITAFIWTSFRVISRWSSPSSPDTV